MLISVINRAKIITGIPFRLSLAKYMDMGVNDFSVWDDNNFPVRPELVQGWTGKFELSTRQALHASTLLSTNGLSGTVVREVIFDEVLSPIYSVLRQSLHPRA